MIAMDRKQQKLLSDLLVISGGDVRLVESALRRTTDRSPQLRDVIAFIKEHREPRLGLASAER